MIPVTLEGGGDEAKAESEEANTEQGPRIPSGARGLSLRLLAEHPSGSMAVTGPDRSSRGVLDTRTRMVWQHHWHTAHGLEAGTALSQPAAFGASLTPSPCHRAGALASWVAQEAPDLGCHPEHRYPQLSLHQETMPSSHGNRQELLVLNEGVYEN